MTSVRLTLLLSLFVVAAIPSASEAGAGARAQMVIENQILSPAMKVDATKWVINIVTIKGIYPNSNLAMRIPCVTNDPSAGVLRTPSVDPTSYKNYGCVAQVIPTGLYKDSLIDQFGQILAPPPQ
jgi:hypothetical protein